MDCWGNISLVHDSSMALVTTMWYSLNPSKDYQRYNSLPREELDTWWQNLENVIVDNLKSLLIPESTKKLLFNLAQPIGKEIQKWLKYHLFLELGDINITDTLVWESPGTIDWKTTAEKIVSNEKLCVLNRFRLACINCLDVVIQQLWPEVRSNFYDFDNDRLNCCEIPDIMFWICRLENTNESLMERIGCNGLMGSIAFSSVISNNTAATKYFLEQLEPQDLFRVATNALNYLTRKRLKCNSSLLAYLISNLSKLNQNVLFVAETENVLLRFLNWPLQNLFLELVDSLWKALTPVSYYNILEEIIRKASEFHHGQVYREIFKEFWDKAPLQFKCYVIHKCIDATFLSRIFSLKETDEFVERIVKYSTVDQRLQMLLGFYGSQTIDYLISKQRWDSLIFFIEVCISDETNVKELKKSYCEHVNKASSYIIISDTDVKKFIAILDDIYESQAKMNNT